MTVVALSNAPLVLRMVSEWKQNSEVLGNT